jgi:glyoxylase-like metal-dependent hydrolase (beta-lactamase superfamily II)
MSHVAGIRIGRVEVEVVCEGWAPLALGDECPGRVVDWDAERARHPWAFADGQPGTPAWRWHVHAFLLRTPDAVVLVDTGVGDFGPYAPWARHEPDAWSGVEPEEIRHVVLTHLHADHSGGSVTTSGPRFPDARYHLHPADWNHFADADDREEYVARQALEAVAAADRLQLQPFDHEIVPGVSLRHAPGHTPGHRSVLVRDDGEALLLTGDLVHTPTSAEHPTWPSSHDVDPQLGSASRRRLLWSAGSEGWTVGVSHFAEPFGSLADGSWHRP